MREGPDVFAVVSGEVAGPETGCGGADEFGELGAVEAAGLVDGGDGEVGVEDCNVHFVL